MVADTELPYRHTGVALLRAAVFPRSRTPDWWPDPDDPAGCGAWLRQVWQWPDLAEGIRLASPSLGRQVDAICAGQATALKQLRRATAAVARYLLRAVGRPTPFGLFAGVAPMVVGGAARVRCGDDHRPVVRVDTQWLTDVVEQLEAIPSVLERLDVVVTDFAVRRGSRLEAPTGPGRVDVRRSAAVRAVQDAAAHPVRFAALADRLAEKFHRDRPVVVGMLTELVRQGFLMSCLRAPMTMTDPLRYLLDRLDDIDPTALPPVAKELLALREDVHRVNTERLDTAQRERSRAEVARRMAALSTAGRTPLVADLVLDRDVRIPSLVADELAHAASALLRLTRHPGGWPAWRDYHAAFCDRYGTGTLVPLTDVVDPDVGLGYPAGYPGSLLPAPADPPTERDERLLALAWHAATTGTRDVTLTDEDITRIAGTNPLDAQVPPHVELAARIHAASTDALDQGEFVLTVAPARAGGTLTSRFTPTTTGSGLEELYRELPVAVDGALPVQLSFPPLYPHAENVGRVPAYLPHLLSLGEHRRPDRDGEASVALADVAVTATRDQLYLVSVSTRQVIEPQVFHALALDKQQPLVRFLAHLSRAFQPLWTVLDWGPYVDRMPYLPRIRYRRSVLAPARWRLTADDLPAHTTPDAVWRAALHAWLTRWRCPDSIDLRDDDRSLRLDTRQLLHAAILRTHLARHGSAILTEPETQDGWLHGHAHEIAVPLIRTGPPAPNPLTGPLPMVSNSHGMWPGERDAQWLSARIHTHPERFDEIIAEHLPELAKILGEHTRCWFIRYLSPHQTDHLRLRVSLPPEHHPGTVLIAVGDWTRGLQSAGLASRLVFDTYHPEVGRYGTDAAMNAAEEVFVADSAVVMAQLRHLPPGVVHPTALVTAGMVHIAAALLDPDPAAQWLRCHPAPPGAEVDRGVAQLAVRLARPDALPDVVVGSTEVARAWQARAAALAAYRHQLPPDADLDTVVGSLLHMHHNRAVGIDPDHERACRRLARQAAHAAAARPTAATT